MDKLRESKEKVDGVWAQEGMAQKVPNPQKLMPLLYMIEIKSPGIITPSVMGALGEMAKQNRLHMILSKLNSDTTPEGFMAAISDVEKKSNKLWKDLTPEEYKIWMRVKEVHDFGDGMKWVTAVDDGGNQVSKIKRDIAMKAAGHCGNDMPDPYGFTSYDRYYELRKGPRAYLTVIVNQNGEIAEAKISGGEKGEIFNKVNHHYKWLLESDIISGVEEMRFDFAYSPDKNVGVKDFAGDGEFFDKIQEKKPSLLSRTDKKVIYYRKKIEDGTYTEEDIIERFMSSPSPNPRAPFNKDNINLWQLRGILGRMPFTEEDLIMLINEGRLELTELGNTDSDLLSSPIQVALVKQDFRNWEIMNMMQGQLEKFEISPEAAEIAEEKYPGRRMRGMPGM